jgi:hypothetical protein
MKGLGQPEDFGSADRRTSQVAGYCERTAVDSSTVDNLSITMTAKLHRHCARKATQPVERAGWPAADGEPWTGLPPCKR